MLYALVEPDAPLLPGAVHRLGDDEARHAARVRRAAVGDAVTLLDGAGRAAVGSIDQIGRGRDAGVLVRIAAVEHVPPPRPRVELWSASPKGDRLPAMVEMLGQVGAASWTPMHTARGVVDPRETRLDRLRRVALDSIKQSHRLWAMDVTQPAAFDDAFDDHAAVLLADFAGDPPSRASADVVRLLIGPEGGWTDEERALARARGARSVRLGPHVMRIGTAAVVGCAALVPLDPTPTTKEAPA